MTTVIAFNGSKWAGQEPDTIERLLEVLREHTLDPTFDKYGGFCVRVGGELAEHYGVNPERAMHFGGNFYDVSHAFGIYTDDKATIGLLVEAIRQNMSTDAYAAARRDRREQDVERAQREQAFLGRMGGQHAGGR
jgi:hypothetical protein